MYAWAPQRSHRSSAVSGLVGARAPVTYRLSGHSPLPWGTRRQSLATTSNRAGTFPITPALRPERNAVKSDEGRSPDHAFPWCAGKLVRGETTTTISYAHMFDAGDGGGTRPAEPAAAAAALEDALGGALPHARAEAALAAIARLRQRANTMTPQNAEWGRAEDHAWALSVAERTLRVVRGEPLRLPDALDLLTVDDDVGGPFPPGPRDAFPATLRSSGAEVTEVAQPTPGRPLVIAVYADIRGWKGRAGLSTRAVAAVANALEVAPDATVVLFGHPRLAAELPAKATHVLAAWGGERLMQEAAARRLAAGRTDE